MSAYKSILIYFIKVLYKTDIRLSVIVLIYNIILLLNSVHKVVYVLLEREREMSTYLSHLIFPFLTLFVVCTHLCYLLLTIYLRTVYVPSFSLIYRLGNLNYIISFSSERRNNTKSAEQNNLYIALRWICSPGRPPQPFDFPSYSPLPLSLPYTKLYYLLCTSFS